MQSNKGHNSKGKGKGTAKENDYVDSVNGVDFEYPPDARAPRSGQGSHQYNQPDYPTWDQYPDNVGYKHQSMSSHNTIPDLYAAEYGGNSITAGGASSYESSYEPSSYFSSGYASSYAASSCAASSYAPSNASTMLSSVPPRYETNTVDHHIAQQQPPQNRYELPCEFRFLTGCPSRFQGGEEREWKEHHEGHLKGRFPTKLNCWFCETFFFDSNDPTCGGDKIYNFDRRMDHIRDHIMDDGYSASSMRPDGGLIKHLKHERLINSQTYNDIIDRLNPRTAPPIPGSRYAKTLPQVVEEPASASNDRRQERKKDRHESSRKRHTK